MVQALSSRGNMDDSMRLFDWMIQNNVQPEEAMYVCLLKPCKDLLIGKRIHSRIIKNHRQRKSLDGEGCLDYYSFNGSSYC